MKINRIIIECFILFLGFFAWQIPAFADEASEANLTNISILPIDQGTTELVLDFNEPVAHTAFLLSNPNRLVLDFPGTTLTVHDENLAFNQTPIKDLRHGVRNGIDLRLVLDLDKDIQFNSTTKTSNGFELVFTLSAPVSVSSSQAVATTKTQSSPSSNPVTKQAQTPNQQATSSLQTSSPVVSVSSNTTSSSSSSSNSESQTSTTTKSQSLTDNTKSAVSSSVANKTSQSDSDSNSLSASMVATSAKTKHTFTVVIDAGHGGKDPGTTGPDGAREKNITLAIADDLEKLVNEQPGMKAVMTRDGDYYVGLRQRLMIARKDKGDIFVAIHADAYTDPYASGASVFALSLHGASSEQALWLAQKENYSELSGIDLNDIQDQDAQVRSVLIDLSQTATIGASLDLGNAVIKQLGEMTPLHHGFVEQAPFMVLKSPDIPSVLVETGFLSNPKEEAHLSSSSYQKKIAQALFDGIQQYYSQDVPRNMSIVTTLN